MSALYITITHFFHHYLWTKVPLFFLFFFFYHCCNASKKIWSATTWRHSKVMGWSLIFSRVVNGKSRMFLRRVWTHLKLQVSLEHRWMWYNGVITAETAPCCGIIVGVRCLCLMFFTATETAFSLLRYLPLPRRCLLYLQPVSHLHNGYHRRGGMPALALIGGRRWGLDWVTRSQQRAAVWGERCA